MIEKKTRVPEQLGMLKGRFEGDVGRRLLIDVLKTQKMVAGDEALAVELADLVTVVAVVAGEAIIRQGACDNDIFFILAGSFSIVVNGKIVAKRGVNDHVGEMSAIEPSQVRSATVIADEDSVVCRLSEPQLAELGRHYGDVWRYFARELVRRLAQRNVLVPFPREKIQVFIASSAEALDIAREVQSHFVHDTVSFVVWTDGVFGASSYTLESLEKAVGDSDFAVVIVQPDDLIKVRGKAKSVPRDNVVFELGLFIGRLGRKRTLLLKPRDREVKLPTDLSGLTAISYQYGKPEDLPALLGPACSQIRKILHELGARS